MENLVLDSKGLKFEISELSLCSEIDFFKDYDFILIGRPEQVGKDRCFGQVDFRVNQFQVFQLGKRDLNKNWLTSILNYCDFWPAYSM